MVFILTVKEDIMKFEMIQIRNFRNFKDIKIKLSNKNVFFGMNDVGKTNFLFALRFVFDKSIRKNGFSNSDFYNKDTSNPIEIIVKINIKDINDEDNAKIRSRIKGNIRSSQDSVYIKLEATYNESEMSADPILYWGGDLSELGEIRTRGYTTDLDSIFNVFYINAYVDLYRFFKKNATTLLKNDDKSDAFKMEKIRNTIDMLNNKISSLSGIKKFEQKVSPQYQLYRNDSIEIKVKSEIAVNGLYENVIPYIRQEGTDNLYPTSGEGRKKLLVYSIYGLLAENEEVTKINLFLIEEPENHLHRALQLSLSRYLFNESDSKYLFLTTHSSLILTEMNQVNLVRIYNSNKINSASIFYEVPKEYKNLRLKLNKGLSEAIFADRVLLVEGPSEEVLFSRVLRAVNPCYEIQGIYILPVLGINFKRYIDILHALNICCIVKTDNDLRRIKGKTKKYSLLGLTRINDLAGLTGDSAFESQREFETTDMVKTKREIYDKNKVKLDEIRDKNKIFLSRVSLEEDLDEAIHDVLDECFSNVTDNPVEYLKNAKKYHMVDLVKKLTDDDCKKIYYHYNFACLKEINRW